MATPRIVVGWNSFPESEPTGLESIDVAVAPAESELVGFELMDDEDAAALTVDCEPVDFEAVDEVEVNVEIDELVGVELWVPEDVLEVVVTPLADCVESTGPRQITKTSKGNG